MAAAASRSDASDPLAGVLLDGRYRVEGRIGEGGMGVVYAAEHTLLGKPVAVKVLRAPPPLDGATAEEAERERARATERAARLSREARVASSVRHPHIVDVVDCGVLADGRPFVVMERLAGESLAERLRREGPLDEARALGIVRQVAEALAAAHAASVLHRDVKPDNVFLVAREGGGPGDFVKLVDFGLSRVVAAVDGEGAAARAALDGERLTRSGFVLGTPLYLSPEQARGEETIDPRVDVYGLGVVLFECLTGDVPYRAANELGVIARIVGEPVPPLRGRAPGRTISAACERLVERMLAKQAEARPSSRELLALLDAVAAGDDAALDAPTPSAPPEPAHPAPLWAYAAIAGLVAIGLALALLVHPQEPPLPTPPSSAPLATSPPSPPITTSTSRAPIAAPPSSAAIAAPPSSAPIAAAPSSATPTAAIAAARAAEAPRVAASPSSELPARPTLAGGHHRTPRPPLAATRRSERVPSGPKAAPSAPGETAPNPY